jgi:ribosomal protein L11 methyltransferase
MPWIQTHLVVDKSRAPLIELLFENLGALSVTLGDAGDEPMLEPAPGETPLWSATRVTGLFSGDTDIDGLRSAINQALNRETGQQLQLEVLEDRDWERAWLERFRPMRFGKRLWICPSGHRVEQPDAAVVDLDPGLAFGTGTHPTTALCLEWLDGAALASRTLIDYGCGSGVLAIAALKLGAAHAIGVDHDPQAILASRDNAQRNGVSERLELFLDRDFRATPAPLVVANILANVLVELQPRLGPLVAPGGELVLSGILREQAEEVIDAYRDTLRFDEPVERDGWVLLHALRA